MSLYVYISKAILRPREMSGQRFEQCTQSVGAYTIDTDYGTLTLVLVQSFEVLV